MRHPRWQWEWQIQFQTKTRGPRFERKRAGERAPIGRHSEDRLPMPLLALRPHREWHQSCPALALGSTQASIECVEAALEWPPAESQGRQDRLVAALLLASY